MVVTHSEALQQLCHFRDLTANGHLSVLNGPYDLWKMTYLKFVQVVCTSWVCLISVKDNYFVQVKQRSSWLKGTSDTAICLNFRPTGQHTLQNSCKKNPYCSPYNPWSGRRLDAHHLGLRHVKFSGYINVLFLSYDPLQASREARLSGTANVCS